jgi:hypothetical protein
MSQQVSRPKEKYSSECSKQCRSPWSDVCRHLQATSSRCQSIPFLFLGSVTEYLTAWRKAQKVCTEYSHSNRVPSVCVGVRLIAPQFSGMRGVWLAQLAAKLNRDCFCLVPHARSCKSTETHHTSEGYLHPDSFVVCVQILIRLKLEANG